MLLAATAAALAPTAAMAGPKDKSAQAGAPGKVYRIGVISAEDALRWDWAQDGSAALFIRMRAKTETAAPFENGAFPLPGYLRMLMRTFMGSG